MSIKPMIKFYAPALGIIAVGILISMCGAVNSETAPTISIQPRTQRERILKDPFGTACILHGKVTINKNFSIKQGVLMVFGEENTTDPATFGDIDSDGVTIPNVPLGNVFLVLRPDTETVLKSIGIPQMKDLQFIRRIETRKQKQMGSGKGSRSNATELAIDPKFLTGLSLDDQLLLVRAFVLYGRPNVDSSLKVAIVRGLNNIDVNFQVPTSK